MFKQVPVTISTVLVVILAYGVELGLAGSTAPQAAHGYILSVIGDYKTAVWYLSPILHSSHSHITGNLILFTPFAFLIERRTDSNIFLLFLLIVAYAGTIGTGIVAGTIGVGISGMAFGVQAREGVYRSHAIRDSETDLEARKHGVVFGIAMFLVLVGLAQMFGYLPSPPGTAETAHFIGVALGFTWAILNLDSLILESRHL